MSPDPWVPRVTVRAEETDGTLVADLTDSFARTWQERINEVGSGQLALENDDAALGDVTYAHVLRFDLDAVPVFAVLVEHRDTVAVTTSEEVEQVTTLSGRGRLAILEEAIMAPYGGEARTQFQQDRLWNFAAPELNDGAWTPVVTRVQSIDPDVDPGSHNTVPQKWPDPNALKIWMDWPIGTRPAPSGDVYMRRWFTTSSPNAIGTYRVFVTADDGYELWIDGSLIIGETNPLIWNETADTEVVLDDGDHIMAIKGINSNFPDNSDNVAWVMASLYALDDGGSTLASVVVHTDGDWNGVGYPADPPGFTPGEVLRLLVAEAQARGALGDVSLGFDDGTDSDGVPWPVTADMAFEVGMDLLSIARQITETYVGRIAMRPGSFVLDAWVTGGAVTSVALAPGVNLTSLQFTGEA